MEIAIKKYIEEKIPVLKDCLCPVFVTDISKLGVSYTFTPLSGGHLSQSQLEMKVIDSDYDLCKEVGYKLTDLMDMEEDESFVVYGGIKFHSGIAGGGTLFNDGCQRWENTLYFIIDWRKINVI